MNTSLEFLSLTAAIEIGMICMRFSGRSLALHLSHSSTRALLNDLRNTIYKWLFPSRPLTLSTFVPIRSKTFLGIATDKVVTFLYEPNCKCYAKGQQSSKGISSSTIAYRCDCRASAWTALCCFTSSLHVLRSMSLMFLVSSLLFLRRNLPPAAAIEHLFRWIDEHPSPPWLFAFLAIPSRLWICLFTQSLLDGKLFYQELSLFFCKLSSTPCCFKSPTISSGENSSSTERSDAVYKPTVGTGLVK